MSNDEMTTRLWTCDEAADYLQVPVRTLEQWRYRRKGPRYVKVGRHVRYLPADVMAWLDEQAALR